MMILARLLALFRAEPGWRRGDEGDTWDAAFAAARARFPNDRIVREAAAIAELEIRQILGRRRHDA